MIDAINWYEAQCIHCADADTITLAITLSPDITQEKRIRLGRVDAYEVGTAEGMRGSAWIQTMVCETADWPMLIYWRGARDKYGRDLAEVYYTRDGAIWHNVSDEVQRRGHSKPYPHPAQTLPKTCPMPVMADLTGIRTTGQQGA